MAKVVALGDAHLGRQYYSRTTPDGANQREHDFEESFEAAVDLLVPELQRRGVYPTAYRPGTLREKLFGEGPYLPTTHPANGYRDIEAVKRRDAELAAPLRKSSGA